MKRAIGICPHTGWAACVVVGGSLKQPEIAANGIVQLLGDAERFCFHRAAEMKLAEAERWIASVRKKATAAAMRALAPLLAQGVRACAIVAKDDPMDTLEYVLAAHPRIHTAEGRFYRDVLREACTVPVRIVAPKSLDASKVGKLAGPPWGRDQRLAALAAWSVLARKP
jgi:hypothetical protein